jgi:hypothetical protein
VYTVTVRRLQSSLTSASHRETSALATELPEESDQFRFLLVSSLVNLKPWFRVVDFDESITHDDFYTVRFVISVFYTT